MYPRQQGPHVRVVEDQPSRRGPSGDRQRYFLGQLQASSRPGGPYDRRRESRRTSSLVHRRPTADRRGPNAPPGADPRDHDVALALVAPAARTEGSFLPEGAIVPHDSPRGLAALRLPHWDATRLVLVPHHRPIYMWGGHPQS